MSKAIQIQSTGGPEVLQLISRDVDRPGLGQVRLAQTAIGLNYVDVMVRTGLFPVGEGRRPPDPSPDRPSPARRGRPQTRGVVA